MALILAACERSEYDVIRAARADSSAAGYELPETAVDRATQAHTASGERAASAQPRGAAAQAVKPAAPPRSEVEPVRPAALAPPTGAAASAPNLAATVPAPARPSAPLAAAPIIPDSLLSDSVAINEFAWYDARAKVLRLELVSGYNALNGSFNFNGGAHGSQTLTVPSGWRVEVVFSNRDLELAHSAAVVPETDPLPVMVPTPGFAGAFTVRLEQGIPDGGRDRLAFAASTGGSYQLVCAVPGHAQSGMWIRLIVSEAAAVPSYGGI